MKMKKEVDSRIGLSGPGQRLFVVAKAAELKHVCYTMDLSPFKVKKNKCCPDCYRVKLSDKKARKNEHLVADSSLLLEHYHRLNDSPVSLPVFESDCMGSSFVAMDESTVYWLSHCDDKRHRHGTSRTLVLRLRLVGDEEGNLSVEEEECASPKCCRFNPQVLVLDGKLYVFGGLAWPGEEEEEYPDYPWSEVFDPATGLWDVFTLSAPSVDLAFDSYEQFSAAIYRSSFLIISPYEGSVFVHDVDTPTGWKLKVSNGFYFGFCSHPLVVGSTIYWLHREIRAYDIEKDAYFEGHFPSYDLSYLIEEPSEFKYRLVHIGGDAEDVFCFVWQRSQNFHFTRVQITKDYDTVDPDTFGIIHTKLISCSSKAADEVMDIADVLLLDRVGGTKKGKLEENTSKEIPDMDALGSKAIGASFLKRCSSKKSLSPDKDALGSKAIGLNVLKICNSKRSFSPEDGASENEVIRSKRAKVDSKESLPSAKDISLVKVTAFPHALGRCSNSTKKSFPSE